MRCSKDRPYENRNFCSQSEIQDMEGSQVPSKKEDHISGCDGEFSVTLMIERFLLLMFVWPRKCGVRGAFVGFMLVS